MAVTGQQVYESALVLMDEVTDTGQILAGNPNYHTAKTKSILTLLQTELLPRSITPTVITDLEQDLLLDDRVALEVLPYGVAAHLILSEGGSGDSITKATFYNARYDELKRKRQATIEPITDNYGVLGGMQ